MFYRDDHAVITHTHTNIYTHNPSLFNRQKLRQTREPADALALRMTLLQMGSKDKGLRSKEPAGSTEDKREEWERRGNNWVLIFTTTAVSLVLSA